MAAIVSDLLIKQVDKRGESVFTFNDNRYSDRLTLHRQHEKGLGLFCENNIDGGTILTSNSSIGAITIGKNKLRLCTGCLTVISKTVKVRDDCPHLGYCSNECLSAADYFITLCGPVISRIHTQTTASTMVTTSSSTDTNNQQTHDMQCLVVNILYHLSGQSEYRRRLTIDSIVTMEAHPDVEQPEMQRVARALFDTIVMLSPQLLSPVSINDGDDDVCAYVWDHDRFYQLLRAIQYNAQPLPVQGIKQASILCLLPTLCRLNHSCTPNASLFYGVRRQGGERSSPSGTAEVVIYLRATRTVSVGEEVCISYLNQPCMRVDSRQEMLRQAFHFDCVCERCVTELRIEHRRLSYRTPSNLPANATGTGIDRFIALDSELDRLVTAQAQTRGSTGPQSAPLSDLLHKAEALLGVAGALEVVPSSAHDAALIVLQAYGSVTTGSSAGSVDVHARKLSELARACLVVCECWRVACAESAPPRVEFIVTCGSYCAQLVRLGGGVDRKYSNLVKQTVGLLREAMSAIDSALLSLQQLAPTSRAVVMSDVSEAKTKTPDVSADTTAPQHVSDEGDSASSSLLLPSDTSHASTYHSALRRKVEALLAAPR